MDVAKSRLKFIVAIEGIDAAGKTTVSRRVAESLGGLYLKGGGWNRDSLLADRAKREENMSRYFSLMQLGYLRELRGNLERDSEHQFIITDRLLLVDVAHKLSRPGNWTGEDFTEEAKREAVEALDTFLSGDQILSKRAIPRGKVLGILFDVGDPAIIENRIKERLVALGQLANSDISREKFIYWLKDHDFGPEADTLENFHLKREALLYCAKHLGWRVINAEGSIEEVCAEVVRVVEVHRSLLEGSVRIGKEGNVHGS